MSKKRRYYYANEQAGIKKRMHNFLFGKKIPDFPESILIQTISGCNARCVFCSQHKLNIPQGKMSEELFRKIVRECKNYEDKLHRFSFAFDNEPLLDKDLSNKIKYVKKECQFVTTNITTNGILLNKERINELYVTEALDEINISIQGVDQDTYSKLTGVKTFDKVMRNMENLADFHNNFKKKKPEIEINTCITPETIRHKDAIKTYWQKKKFKVHFIKIDNRAGSIDGYKERITHKSLSYYLQCKRPFHTMIICWDGTAPLCCADYERKCPVGNVSTNTLSDVWNGNKMIKARKELLEGKFKFAKICANCKIDD